MIGCKCIPPHNIPSQLADPLSVASSPHQSAFTHIFSSASSHTSTPNCHTSSNPHFSLVRSVRSSDLGFCSQLGFGYGCPVVRSFRSHDLGFRSKLGFGYGSPIVTSVASHDLGFCSKLGFGYGSPIVRSVRSGDLGFCSEMGFGCGCPKSFGPGCKAMVSDAVGAKGTGNGAKDNGWKFERKKLAVFLSGGGSNFRALHEAILENRVYGDIVVVVSDKPGCKGCDYAKEHGIPVVPYPKGKLAPDGVTPIELVQTLRSLGVDYALLAGYLKLLPVELVQAYPRSILNIHPALLPAFGGKGYYGMRVHEAVIKSGARYSGPTIHFVDEKYDHGPILAQRVVKVLPDDSPNDLANRVLKEEHSLYVEAAAALCEDRIFWRKDGVPLIRKSWDEAEYY